MLNKTEAPYKDPKIRVITLSLSYSLLANSPITGDAPDVDPGREDPETEA